jgi:hypothetical protein
MTTRGRRAGVEDRWTKVVKDENGKPARVPSAKHGEGKRWLARWVDAERAASSRRRSTVRATRKRG